MGAAAVPEGLEPLAVWDPNTLGSGWFDSHHRERIKWAMTHLDRPADTSRVDFYLLDTPFAVLHRYARDENGRIPWDPETGGAVMEEPVVQLLAELPSAHLLETR